MRKSAGEPAHPPRRPHPGSPMWILLHIRLLLPFLLWQTLVPSASAQQQKADEFEVKAAFLFHFTKYIDWPSSSFADSQSPIVIGVLGKDPFGARLDDAVRGRQSQGRRIEIRRSQNPDELRTCHVLFICKSEHARTGEILAPFQARPTLTVSEQSSFTRTGGILQLYMDAQKVRFEINAVAAERAQLRVHAPLLQLGRPTPVSRE